MNQTKNTIIELFLVGIFYSLLAALLTILLPNLRFLSIMAAMAGIVNYLERSFDEALLREGLCHV